jgi:leader peptidase (prepilin peptidase)/N-methyltransferase
MVPALVLTAVMGAVLGSFLNVVAWRLPRGESLVSPGSQCPSCAVAIKPYDNVPVFGWLWLRGHCRACDAPISARYPVVEAVTAVLYAAVVAARWDDVAQIALGLALVTLLVPMVLIDLEHRLIPNRLTLPFAVLALALGLVLDRSLVGEQLVAGAAAGGFFLVAALAYPRGMGMGDVKLAAVLGLYLGRAVAPAIFIGLIAGVLAGAVIIARKGAADGRKTAVPFGPFLALGALAAVFCGQAIVDAYLERF